METAASAPLQKIFAGAIQDSGRKLEEERPSRRPDREASMPPSIPIHSVSCCTITAEPGMPDQRNIRAIISITGSAVIRESARMENESSKI